MKTVEELKNTSNLLICQIGSDGGHGYVHYGSLKNCTVIWSYGGGWEHVSIAPTGRTPTWDEMCKVKNMFWHEDETVIQYHPASSDYVNLSKTCLHLWKPIDQKLLIPPQIFV
ncbi:MAG: DUF7694 domain-containing protein [Lachnospiraceae bacterium]